VEGKPSQSLLSFSLARKRCPNTLDYITPIEGQRDRHILEGKTQVDNQVTMVGRCLGVSRRNERGKFLVARGHPRKMPMQA
jgi:hypothetical protein